MSQIGIFGIAFGRNWERYDSWHTPPEVTNYIESVSPDSVPHKYKDGGKYYEIDTTNSGCTVTAASQVVLPTKEVCPFSYWLVQPDPLKPIETWSHRALDLFQLENGIIGLYFGVKRLPINWPGFDGKVDRYVHILMGYGPVWQLDHPMPGGMPGPGGMPRGRG